MATKKSVAKKAPVKKAAAKKAPAKKAAAKKQLSSPPKEEAVKEPKKLSVAQVAKKLHTGSLKWGTGRDRDTNLQAEGYDLTKVRSAMQDLRREELTADK